MVTIRIGSETKSLGDASESWVNQAIQQQRHSGFNPCVEVNINVPGINVRLETPGCGTGGGGGGRPATSKEREVLDLWHKRGLDDSSFASGNVVAFLKQVQRLLG